MRHEGGDEVLADAGDAVFAGRGNAFGVPGGARAGENADPSPLQRGAAVGRVLDGRETGFGEQTDERVQIGRFFGPKVFHWESSRFFNKAALEKTHAFYEKHGGKTLIISRFLPLFRTFAPFVAGIGAMSYARFSLFNLIGGVAWVGSLTLAGYWFGNIPWIQKNLTAVILAIIGISFVPVLIGWLQHRREASVR